jgi:decaprenylphospho-beta-D-ribofuranose 2-oxidase
VPDSSARLLTGWGRTSPTRAEVIAPSDTDELAGLLSKGGPLVARGLGRSYGDAAQCAGGTVVDTSRFDSLELVDPTAGVLRAGAGVSLDRIMRELLPQGWFVPVTPGTRQVTVGGAIAADIHGKNHHRDGSWCRHVTSVDLVTPTGRSVVGPDDPSDSELFWATAGGMGLTGVVTAAIVRLTPVDTTWMRVDTERTRDLETVMAVMESSDHRYRYSVAWVDCMTRGRHLGRAVLTRGDHAGRDDLPVRRRATARAFPSGTRLRVPVQGPPGLLNLATITAFNEAMYRRAPKRRDGELQSIPTFFHPLDGVGDWNLLYGPRGFVQYQFVVGFEHGETVRHAIELLSDARLPSFLAVLKRFGAGDEGPLSFPVEGWTLALDLPVGPERLPQVLRRLDELVIEAGGRVYLAKDARLPAAALRAMYPRLGELTAVRRRIDPQGVLRSDLSRRLGLDDLEPDGEVAS